MAIQNTQTTLSSDSRPSSLGGQKIYPITAEMLEADEDVGIRALERLEKRKAEQAAASSQSTQTES